jgi:hypothetical protein
VLIPVKFPVIFDFLDIGLLDLVGIEMPAEECVSDGKIIESV